MHADLSALQLDPAFETFGGDPASEFSVQHVRLLEDSHVDRHRTLLETSIVSINRLE
jgi:hypothetical protein